MKWFNFLLGLSIFACLISSDNVLDAKDSVEASYTVKNIETPDEAFLEVGGMDIDSQGKIYMCTRRGDIWTLKDDKH